MVWKEPHQSKGEKTHDRLGLITNYQKWSNSGCSSAPNPLIPWKRKWNTGALPGSKEWAPDFESMWNSTVNYLLYNFKSVGDMGLYGFNLKGW